MINQKLNEHLEIMQKISQKMNVDDLIDRNMEVEMVV